MKRTNGGFGRWWSLCSVALGALLWVVGPSGCSSSESGPSGPSGQVQRPQRPPPRLTMSPRTTWQRLNADGPWAVSPRFVDNALVLLSGRVGRGLLLAQDSGVLHVIDPVYQGPVEVQGRVICLPNHRATMDDVPALPGGLRLAGADSCPPTGFNPELGQVLHESAVGRWSLFPRRGELVFVPMGGAAVLVEDRVPFSIRVSPDGRRAAYAVGKLPSPTLILWDAEQGRRVLGVGVHPVFHPDGLLIYSRPDGRLRLGNLTSVARAELRAHDLTTHESWNLTDTPDLAEMQPALSPDGNRLAFSDWRRGGAFLVTLSRRVTP